MQHLLAAMSAPGSFLPLQPFTDAANATTASALVNFGFSSAPSSRAYPSLSTLITQSLHQVEQVQERVGAVDGGHHFRISSCLHCRISCLWLYFFTGCRPSWVHFCQVTQEQKKRKKKERERAVAHFLCAPSLPPGLCLEHDIIVRRPEERALSDNSSPVHDGKTGRTDTAAATPE